MTAAPAEMKREMKELIVSTLRLENVTPDAIGDDEPLFSQEQGLGLDSLSALEILSAIEFKWKVTFPNDGSAKEHFRSVGTLSNFVQSMLPR